jgi:hypothetical protein
MMVVPAIGLAWLLVSLSPGQAPVSLDALQSHLDEMVFSECPSGRRPACDGTSGGERVMLRIVTPEIVRVAQTFLDLPMGTERFATIDGRRYVFVLEQHYHPPGFIGAPSGYHKGVTVYELRP